MNLDFLLHWMNVEKYLKSDFEHEISTIYRYNHIQNLYLGRYIVGYMVGNLVVKCDSQPYIQ